MRTRTIVIMAYATAAVATFGHATNAAARFDTNDLTACQAARMRNCTDMRPDWAVGLASAVFWPLYWSQEVQR